jgi:hypothetical protein
MIAIELVRRMSSFGGFIAGKVDPCQPLTLTSYDMSVTLVEFGVPLAAAP